MIVRKAVAQAELLIVPFSRQVVQKRALTYFRVPVTYSRITQLYRRQQVLFLSTSTIRNQQLIQKEESNTQVSGGPADVSAAPPTVDVPYIPAPPAPPPADILESVSDTSFHLAGLGGYTPVGLLQEFINYLHVSLDFPWWGAIAVTTVILRTCMFPVAVYGQKRVARMQNNMPELQQIQAKVSEAQQRGDRLGAAIAAQNMISFMHEKDIHPLKHLVPLLVQFPVFISMFLCLRGMSTAPAPAFTEGGLYWFLDLTIPDPYFLLPLFTSSTMLFIIRNAAEGGATPESMGPIMKYVLMGMPFLILPFSVNFAAGVTCYWAMTNLYSVGQFFLLRNTAMRDWLQIPRLIKHDPSVLKKKKGFRQEFREAWNKKKVFNEAEVRRVSERNFIQAGNAPIPKTFPKPKVVASKKTS